MALGENGKTSNPYRILNREIPRLAKSRVSEPETHHLQLPILADADHLVFLIRKIPDLIDKRSIDQSKDLVSRVDRMYGERLKANPSFRLLLEPLIIMATDAAGHHMSFVMSDFRISFLHLYAEKINPPIFRYDEVLEMIAQPKGPIRYARFMLGLSCISPLAVDFARLVWERIKVISEAQLDVLDRVLGVLDDQNLKLEHTSNVFLQMFQTNQWDKAYWDSYIETISKKDDPDDLVDSMLGLNKM